MRTPFYRPRFPALRVLACLFAVAVASPLPARAQITVAVAANVQYAMEELKTDFERSSGAVVKTVYGASGSLAAQIGNGAPFDVFVSADMDFPDSLAVRGYASADPKPYAFGKLVLWTSRDWDPARGISLLAGSAIARIALADTQRAPYGREAVRALKKSGFYERVKTKLVFGESVSQVNQYVSLGTVDAGFTAKSAVVAGPMRGKGKWAEVDSSLYEPIAQGAVVCKYGSRNHPALSALFLGYLYSAPARTILAKYGYVLP